MVSKNVHHCGSVAASRRVSDLTPEQVEKKRAIDRDNQRHHRKKTKAYIRSLEQKVAELTTRLGKAETMLEQHRMRQNDNSRPFSALSNSSTDLIGASDPPKLVEASNNPEIIRLESVPLTAEDSFKDHLNSLPLDLGTGMTIHSWNSVQDFNFLDWELADVVDSLSPNMDILLHDTSMYDTMVPPSYEVRNRTWTPEWQILPLHIPATTKLDEVIINTTDAWRTRLQQGHHDEDLNKSVFPSIPSLLNRPNQVYRVLSTSFSDTVAAQVWRTPIKTLPERIGFVYNLAHLIRWLVCRSKDTYEKMPAFLKPTKLQQTVPHAAWIDTVIWPEARDALIKYMDLSRFEELRALSGGSISVNWPSASSGMFKESPDRQTLMLYPEFEAHIQQGENWRFGREVGIAFPFLKPFCR